jgi:hypothetical protein
VLGEVAEDVRVHLADDTVGIDLDARLSRLGREGKREEHGHARHDEAKSAALSFHEACTFIAALERMSMAR